MGGSFGFESGVLNFDPQAFARSLYNTIEASKGRIGRRATKLIDSPADEAFADEGENPINAFFRILGMPAIRSKTGLTFNGQRLDRVDLAAQLRDKIYNQGGTINYVDSIGIGTEDALKALAQRDSFLNQKLDPDTFNELIRNPLPVDASINGPAFRKVPILPLVVDASIPIYPQSKRVAPLFNIEDYVVSGGKQRLSRPFLEHIIYMRTKVFSGGATASTSADNSLEKQLAANIETQVPEGGATSPRDNLLEALGDFSLLELKITEKFIQTLKAMAIDYEKVRRRALEMEQEVIYSPAPSRRARDKTGSTRTAKDEDFRSILDGQIAAIDTELNKIDAFLITLPSEIVAESDRIRRIGQSTRVGNISTDLLVPDFNNLLSSERIGLEKIQRDLKDERSRKIREFEILKERLMFYTGEGVGLSIFDILCVLFALFTVPLDIVIGLLNKDAQDRILKNDPFYSNQQATGSDAIFNINTVQNALADPVPVGQALDTVEAIVKENFELVNTFIKTAQASGEATTTSTAT